MPKLLHETIEFKAIAQDYKLEPLSLTYAIIFCEENFIKESS
jgi:hypothetical protein